MAESVKRTSLLCQIVNYNPIKVCSSGSCEVPSNKYLNGQPVLWAVGMCSALDRPDTEPKHMLQVELLSNTIIVFG